jgi:deoxyribodipyrimidine photo-lyase
MTDRVRLLNRAEPRAGDYILYWSQMNRRADSNHALAFAAELANERGLPVLFYEGLTCSYPHANDRLHTFLLEGVPETERRLDKLGIGYVFHLRRRRSDPNDALHRLAERAAAIVTDDYPTFVAAAHNASVPAKVRAPYYAVDSSCIVPMRRFEKQEYAAYTIRPKIQRMLREYLAPVPAIRVKRKWSGPLPMEHTRVEPDGIADLVASCEIDHTVPPSIDLRGGRIAAESQLRVFLENNLKRYARHKNEPSEHATSQLSAYLHFGHMSSLEIAIAVRDCAAKHKLIAEEYLEELIVRRELTFNFALHSPYRDSIGALPNWAKTTLAKHARDRRDPLYTRDQFERAETYDDLWNATQREMLTRGVIHGYYRMYWGKKIIEWSKSPEDALASMLAIHDRYALDGRDPNTYTNCLWCFGLHDRPWGERPIFGMVRFMSLEGMRRKTDVDAYIREMSQGRLL